MSRTHRKTPIVANTLAESEKKDKREANRRLRRAVKHRLKQGKATLRLREVSNVWSMAKDGKRYNPQDNRRK